MPTPNFGGIFSNHPRLNYVKRKKYILASLAAVGAAVIGFALSSCASADYAGSSNYGNGYGSSYSSGYGYGSPAVSAPAAPC